MKAFGYFNITEGTETTRIKTYLVVEMEQNLIFIFVFEIEIEPIFVPKEG
jgi:hypothetical protein